MERGNTEAPIDDITYLARSEHRPPTLIALAVRPRSRSELWEKAGVSESTIRRTLGEFSDRDRVRREGYQHEATQLGTTSAMAGLIDWVETGQTFRMLRRFHPRASGFGIELSDAAVTTAESDDSYCRGNRFRSSYQETTSIQHDECAVACSNSVTGGSGDGCWTG